MFGGASQQGQMMNDLWKLNVSSIDNTTNTNTTSSQWQRLTEQAVEQKESTILPRVRCSHVAVEYKNKL